MNKIFAEMADAENDQTRRDIYINFSRGLYPKGIEISGSYFCKVYGKRFIKLKIDDDTEAAKYQMETLIDTYVLKKTGKTLPSSTSLTRDMITWPDIKKNHMLRQIFVSEFCADEKEKYSLTDAQTDTLSGLINVNIFLELITESNVVIDNKIVSIDNLCHRQGEYYLTDEDSRDIYTLCELLL